MCSWMYSFFTDDAGLCQGPCEAGKTNVSDAACALFLPHQQREGANLLKKKKSHGNLLLTLWFSSVSSSCLSPLSIMMLPSPAPLKARQTRSCTPACLFRLSSSSACYFLGSSLPNIPKFPAGISAGWPLPLRLSQVDKPAGRIQAGVR